MVQVLEKPHGVRVGVVGFTGSISGDDYEQLSEEMALKDLSNTSFKVAVLNSTGGEVYEAMKIGRLLRRERFDTTVPQGGACQSACVYLLAAGIGKAVYGLVGIHRPYFSVSPNGDAGASLKRVKAISADYFDEMNVPTRLADDMYSIQPSDMKVLSVAELGSYRLNQRDFVIDEQEAITNMDVTGWDRQQYETFRTELNYRCSIYIGQMERMRPCIREIARKHHAPAELVEYFGN
ncbi:COG3904 family protein [Pseudomonas sp. Marseille-QA0892]